MLRKTLESRTGPLTDSQFAEIKDLVETDIRVNRIFSGKETSPEEEIEIAVRCFIALGRGRAA